MEPPDRQERLIRIGCGALFGLAWAGLAILRFGGLPWPWAALGVVAAVGACGYAAARQGDEFWWESLRSRWR